MWYDVCMTTDTDVDTSRDAAAELSPERRLALAEGMGGLPAADDRRIPLALALKLTRFYPSAPPAAMDLPRAGIREGEAVMGLLDSRPLAHVCGGRTTLVRYAGLPASVKIWESREKAALFAELENQGSASGRHDRHWSVEVL